MTSEQPVTILRGTMGILVAAYLLATYLELHPSELSSEARQYQTVVLETASGFSMAFALQKLSWILGSVLGLLGVTLLFFRIIFGLPCLMLSAPLLVGATLLGHSPAAYPPIQSTASTLLWCLTSAAWSATTVYALIRRDLLFPGRPPQN